ncbi:hypothetical protein IMZ48_29785 [Candidatus Bathyarchaeota archaeon]|nr:hypothetical protein [Candidatus Bathyarchaeota archaeon]
MNASCAHKSDFHRRRQRVYTMDEVPNRGHQLEGVNYFFAVMAFLSVLLRTYVRVFIVKSFAYDDAFMIVALVRIGSWVSSVLGKPC